MSTLTELAAALACDSARPPAEEGRVQGHAELRGGGGRRVRGPAEAEAPDLALVEFSWELIFRSLNHSKAIVARNSQIVQLLSKSNEIYEIFTRSYHSER